jgi:hypothetical protein
MRVQAPSNSPRKSTKEEKANKESEDERYDQITHVYAVCPHQSRHIL